MNWLKTIIDFILKLLRTSETPRSHAKGKIYIRYKKKRNVLHSMERRIPKACCP
jgi:hypothetical protein